MVGNGAWGHRCRFRGFFCLVIGVSLFGGWGVGIVKFYPRKSMQYSK